LISDWSTLPLVTIKTLNRKIIEMFRAFEVSTRGIDCSETILVNCVSIESTLKLVQGLMLDLYRFSLG